KLGKDPHPPPVKLFGVRVDLDGLLQNSQGLVELALPGLELGKPGGGIEDLAAQGLADRFAPLAETPLEEVATVLGGGAGKCRPRRFIAGRGSRFGQGGLAPPQVDIENTCLHAIEIPCRSMSFSVPPAASRSLDRRFP